MSRTRSEGGATVVRVDAITNGPVNDSAVQCPESEIAVRPGLSVCLNQESVNENKYLQSKGLHHKQLLFARQLFRVFYEADEYYHGGTH